MKKDMNNFWMIRGIGLFLIFIGFQHLHAQSIEEYLQLAAENNPGLKAKYTQFEKAMVQVSQSKGMPDPILSFGYFVSPIETRVGPQQAKFSLVQMFPWFGTLRANEARDTLTAHSQYQEFLNARNQLFYEVKSRWYPLYEVNQSVVVLQKDSLLLEQMKESVTARYQNGNARMTDVLGVEILLDEVRMNLHLLHYRKKMLTVQFNRLLNRQDSLEVFVADTLNWDENLAKVEMGDISSNPLIEAYALKIQSAEASEMAARKKGGPTIGLGLDYVMVGSNSNSIFTDNGKDAFMPMVSLSLPIYRTKYEGAIQMAQLEQSALEAGKLDLENQLASNYQSAMYDLVRSIEQVKLYAKNRKHTQMSLDLLWTAYQNSNQNLTEILRMQQNLVDLEIKENQSITEFYLALARLDYLTGK
jgi:outer membrane protein TolC